MEAQRFEGLTAEECISRMDILEERAREQLVRLWGFAVDAVPGSETEYYAVRVLSAMTELLALSRASVSHLRDSLG